MNLPDSPWILVHKTKFTSSRRAALKNMAQVTHSTGLANLQQKNAIWESPSQCANHFVATSPFYCSVCMPQLFLMSPQRNKLYSDLCNPIQSTPAEDKVMVLGDVNARVGRDAEAWKRVIGKHGVGNCNDNWRLLFEFSVELQLSILNTIFQQRGSLKTTWMHPRSKHWHLLDYVLVRQRGLKDALHTRVMLSAEYQTDHRLVRCMLRLYLKFKPRRGGAPCKKVYKQKAKIQSYLTLGSLFLLE